MVRFVIFDLDGVIVDSEPVHQRLEDEMFRELALDITPEDRKKLVGTSSVDMWKFIKKEYGVDLDPQELLLKGRQRYWDVLENTEEVRLVPGILELLNDLKGRNIKMLVASSATLVTINKVIDIFKLGEWFQGFVGGDQVTRSKPDPEIFLKAVALLGADPLECLVIEDSGNGIKAARAAGMKSIGYRNPLSGQQDLAGADWVVDDLREIDLDVVLK